VTLTDVGVVANTSAGSSSAAGAAVGGTGKPSFTSAYSNYYDNGASPFDTVSDPVGADGNVEVDPLYTDTSPADGRDWDLHLAAGSSCIDAGDPALLDVDGTTSDIGAYGGAGGDW
jgi:hypothetical protein